LENYFRLSILKLKKFISKQPLDIYVRLSEQKFVKVSSKDNLSPNETLNSFQEKGLNYLYVKEEDFNSLMTDVESDMNEALNGFSDLNNLDSQYEGLSNLLEDTKSLVVNLGINEKTCEHVDNMVKKTMYSFSKWDSIQDLTELLLKKNDYINSHGILCSLIATSVLQKVDWSTDEIERKIIMASLFQNICLDKDIHAKIYDREGEVFKGLETYEKDIVLGHPIKAAKLLDFGEFTGFEVASMVRNHHEHPGTGVFPRGRRSTGENIGPLEAIFIISAYFAHRVIVSESKPIVMAKEIQDLNELFYQGNFKKTFEHFLSVFR